jgi:hypothetical protein
MAMLHLAFTNQKGIVPKGGMIWLSRRVTASTRSTVLLGMVASSHVTVTLLADSAHDPV